MDIVLVVALVRLLTWLFLGVGIAVNASKAATDGIRASCLWTYAESRERCEDDLALAGLWLSNDRLDLEVSREGILRGFEGGEGERSSEGFWFIGL